MYPHEIEAFRKVRKVVKDYGVNSELEVSPFKQKNTGKEYIAIYIGRRQLCCIENGKKLTRIVNINAYTNKRGVEIGKPDEILSKGKSYIEGVLKAWGYKKTS